MPTRTRFVFLMHPKEYKQEKAATGRLTHLCLPNSEIQVGVEFDRHDGVQSLLHDSRYACHMLYPGPGAVNLSRGDTLPALPPGRELLVFILDGTWSCARKMLRLSPSLQTLPRIMFTATAPSRYIIKQQPQPECLSTLEATHEVLLALADRGLDVYTQPTQLLALFRRMQDFQIRCATDPAIPGYRRHPYQAPEDRKPFEGHSKNRRNRFFTAGVALPNPAGPRLPRATEAS